MDVRPLVVMIAKAHAKVLAITPVIIHVQMIVILDVQEIVTVLVLVLRQVVLRHVLTAITHVRVTAKEHVLELQRVQHHVQVPVVQADVRTSVRLLAGTPVMILAMIHVKGHLLVRLHVLPAIIHVRGHVTLLVRQHVKERHLVEDALIVPLIAHLLVRRPVQVHVTGDSVLEDAQVDVLVLVLVVAK